MCKMSNNVRHGQVLAKLCLLFNCIMTGLCSINQVTIISKSSLQVAKLLQDGKINYKLFEVHIDLYKVYSHKAGSKEFQICVP